MYLLLYLVHRLNVHACPDTYSTWLLLRCCRIMMHVLDSWAATDTSAYQCMLNFSYIHRNKCKGCKLHSGIPFVAP